MPKLQKVKKDCRIELRQVKRSPLPYSQRETLTLQYRFGKGEWITVPIVKLSTLIAVFFLSSCNFIHGINNEGNSPKHATPPDHWQQTTDFGN